MSIVEIDVSGRCEHECFYITAATRSVWHFYGRGSGVADEGPGPVEADPEDAFIFHDELRCDPAEPCACFAEVFDG